MDRIANYRQIIQKILIEYQQWAASANESSVEQCVAFDQERNRLILLLQG